MIILVYAVAFNRKRIHPAENGAASSLPRAGPTSVPDHDHIDPSAVGGAGVQRDHAGGAVGAEIRVGSELRALVLGFGIVIILSAPARITDITHSS